MNTVEEALQDLGERDFYEIEAQKRQLATNHSSIPEPLDIFCEYGILMIYCKKQGDPSMLEQTKTAIHRLQVAGLDRHEFRIITKKTKVGYGDAQIVLLADTARSVQLTPAMRQQGLSVTHCTVDGRVACVLVASDGKGEFSEFKAR